MVNNAASFYAGYFEELTPEQFERQLSVSLIGPMNVTRAVLPVMRKQRSGHIISISSSAGLAAGYDFASAYAASKFGLEGWMESLQAEVAPFGITTTVVNPNFFRTELLTDQSTTYAKPSIADYDERRGPLVEYWKAQNGQQSEDPRSSHAHSLRLRSQRFATRNAASRPPANVFVDLSLSSTSPIGRFGSCWLWRRGFGASPGQSCGQCQRMINVPALHAAVLRGAINPPVTMAAASLTATEAHVRGTRRVQR